MADGPEFVDNPHAPDIFADAATGIFTLSGNVRLTFESVRCEHSKSPGPIRRVVIGRLVMPEAAAEQMARMILENLERFRASDEAKTATKN